jgi:hypothetical protein
VLCIALSFARPSWWVDLAPDDGRDAAAAEQLENAVISQLSLARPGEGGGEGYRSEPWTVSVSQEDANAWLMTRLKPWAASRGIDLPAGLDAAQVELGPGVVRAAARVRLGGRGRFLVAVLSPEVNGEGRLRLLPRRLGIGALVGPAALGQSAAGALLPEGASSLLTNAGAALEPVIRLSDGRRVRLLELAVRSGRLELTCRTER